MDSRENDAKHHASAIWSVVSLDKAPMLFRDQLDHVEPDALVVIWRRGVAKGAKEIKKGAGILG